MSWKASLASPVVVIALATGAPAQETQPLNADNGRALIASNAWPWQSIGRVNLAIATQRSFCTGTLVAPAKVLTAAHCLFNHRLKQWVKPDALHFVAGVSPGPTYAESSTVESYAISPKYKNAREGGQPDFKQREFGQPLPAEKSMCANDWAILTLQRPLKARPIPVYVPSADEKKGPIEAVLPGYGADRPYALSVARHCDVTIEPASLGPGSIYTLCQIAPGGSGSPILLLQGDEAKVIGVASSGEQLRPGSANGGGLKRSATFLIAIGASSSSFSDALR